jgi:hypothetical protein
MERIARIVLRFQDLIEAERGPVLVAVDALVMV